MVDRPMEGATTDAREVQLKPVSGASVWYGPEMAKRSDWIRHFTESEIAELDSVVRALDATGIDIVAINQSNFVAPGLMPLVAEIMRLVRDGPGFILLRGLPVERWTRRQAAIAYFGLAKMAGEVASQNAKGHVLGHVKDIGRDYAKATERGYQTSARLAYHCDASDIVGLLCLMPSKSGGLSSIAASGAIYNEMLKRRPDLVAELVQPVYRDRRGEVPQGADPWYAVPVFNPMPDGRLVTAYVRSAMRKAQRFPEVPRSTAALESACDLLDQLAESPEIHLDMGFKPGDIQYLNNHTILHSRTAFEDYEELEKRRHLWRIWIACSDWPPLPDVYTKVWQGAIAGNRPAGIRIEGVPLVAPLDAF